MPEPVNSAARRIRILIVDDHAVVRHGLALVLRLEQDFEVAGEACDGKQALEMAHRLKPDLVLMDLVMPGMDGLQTVLVLSHELPGIRILILSGAELDDRLTDVLAAGVDGYALKDVEPEDLRQAIRAVMRGEAYLHPLVARRVLDRLTTLPRTSQQSCASIHQPPASTSISPTASMNFTPRELEVLQQMATAASYKEIAARLFISEETVRTHAKHILNKVGQPNRVQAVLAAVRAGWIKLPAE